MGSRSRGLRVIVFAAGSAGSAASLLLACGSGSSSGTPADPIHVGADAAIDRARLAQPIVIDASCQVVIDTPPLLAGEHVPEGTAITWSSNPPSSGPHYPIWANYQEFDKPVDRGYLVHSMEHGGVVLFYKCDADAASCDADVTGLRQVRDAVPADPLCSPPIKNRIVIVPDPLLDVPIAAAAWGWTYKAPCLDVPTLTQFAKDHVTLGTEDTCAPGKTTF
jgi:hypothetical protein